MTRAHRIILVLYLVTVAAICLYVPWMFTSEQGQRLSLEYGLLWDPPKLHWSNSAGRPRTPCRPRYHLPNARAHERATSLGAGAT
jgi:hypothetical protein